MVKIVTNKNFDEEVIHDGGVVLVDFHASWCRPCKMLAPIIEELGNEFSGKVKICKADVEENGDVVRELS